MNNVNRSRLVVALTVVGIASIALTGGAVALDGAATQEQDGQANGTLLEDGFYDDPTQYSDGDHTYRIQLEKGERVHIAAYFTYDGIDASLQASGPNGESHAADHRGSNEHLIFTAAHSGTFEIHVGTGSAYDYDLEVRTGPRSVQAREPDSYWGASSPMVPGTHGGFEIRHAADRDFYHTFAKKGQTVDITVSHAEGAGPFEVVVRDNNETSDELIRKRTTTEGTTISVTSQGADRGYRFVGFYVRSVNGTTGTYDVDLSVNGSFALDQWQNGSKWTSTSSPISDGTYTHTLPSGRYSVYNFRVEQGQNVSISVTGNNGDAPTPMVLDPDGKIVANGESITFTPTKDGIHTIFFSTPDEKISYTLAIEGAVDWTAADGSGSGGGSGGGSSGGMPGFGALAALVALLLGTAATRVRQ